MAFSDEKETDHTNIFLQGVKKRITDKYPNKEVICCTFEPGYFLAIVSQKGSKEPSFAAKISLGDYNKGESFEYLHITTNDDESPDILIEDNGRKFLASINNDNDGSYEISELIPLR